MRAGGREDGVVDEVIPSSERVRRAMRAQRTRDTRPETTLRRALHRRGLRYRVHQRPLPDLRRTVDVVFRPARVAVEVRGCFWHACEAHGTWPKANADWWARKLEGNRRRDEALAAALAEASWELVVVWEHDDPESAADLIALTVANRRPVHTSFRSQPPSRTAAHTENACGGLTEVSD